MDKNPIENSPPKSIQKPVPRFIEWTVRQGGWLTWLLLSIALGSLFALPELGRKVFFDENALLTGSVLPTYRASNAIREAPLFRKSTLEAIGKLKGGAHVDFVAKALESIGLEVSIQAFNSSSSIACKNVHGILRSPRGDGKEAMVFVTPLDLRKGSWQSDEGGASALAIGYGLFYHLDTVAWLAKDLIWVVTDGRCGSIESMRVWLEEYHAETDRTPTLSQNFVRGGVLQQAVVLEMPNSTFNTWELSVEGVNGQLPKLDIHWLARFIANHVLAIPSSLGKGVLFASPLCGRVSAMAKIYSSWEKKMQSMTCFILRQAIGVPTGSHSVFKNWAVDAVTVRPITEPQAPKAQPDAIDWKVGRLAGANPDMALLGMVECIELMFRACNSLLEKLHHSYFYYVLINTDQFITIEFYIIPVVLMLAAMTLKAAVTKSSDEQHQDSPYWKEAMLLCISCHSVFALLTWLLQSTKIPPFEPPHQNSHWKIISTIIIGLVGCVELGRGSWRKVRGMDDLRSFSDALSSVSVATTAVLVSAFVSVNWALTLVGLLLIAPVALTNYPKSKLSMHGKCLAIASLSVCSPVAVLSIAVWLVRGGVPNFSDFTGVVETAPIASVIFWSMVYFPFWLMSVYVFLS
ncbi:hypothetical protein BSKO_11391 [Bryopsis sp. KO-2023]|nr:hypothetical protein BSKO_11391 [Bryopsis sp. KO-2023]